MTDKDIEVGNMETMEVGTEETGQYGAGHDEFAFQGDSFRGIVEVNVEAEDPASAETIMHDLRNLIPELVGEPEITPREETKIPTGELDP